MSSKLFCVIKSPLEDAKFIPPWLSVIVFPCKILFIESVPRIPLHQFFIIKFLITKFVLALNLIAGSDWFTP